MSPTIQIRQLDDAVPAAGPARRPRGRSIVHRQAVLAIITTILVMTVASGCTAQPAEQPQTPSAPTTAVVPLLEDQPRNTLAPDRYIVTPFDAPSSAPLAPVLDIPKGYSPIDGSGVIADDADDPVLWLWDISSVYTHPCKVGAEAKQVGPSLADLAHALAAQPMRDGTDPIPVTVGGYDGLYVEISTPEDLDLATCRDGYFHSWPGRSEQVPGKIDLLWIVDAAGQRITFNLSYLPDSTPARVNELKKVVTTATFIHRPAPR